MKRCIAISLLLCGLLNAEALSPTCYRDNERNVVICSEKKLGRLMWQDEGRSSNGTWDEVQEYCKTLSLAGYKDWRLPTRVELLSIADRSKEKLALNMAFKYVSINFPDYWSQTENVYYVQPSEPWVVHFWWSGFANVGGLDRAVVRCVRQD